MTARPVGIRRPRLFWSGVGCICAGVVLHVPDFAADMGHRMVGMHGSPLTWTGMVLIGAGLPLAAWSLLSHAPRPVTHSTTAALIALDHVPLRGAHWSLTGVIGVALVIDTMKPATLGFVLPGTAAEYGLDIGTAALLPITALTGTTLGSLMWGLLADRIGRRPTILLSGLLFMATSVCGFMPTFAGNLAMCFVMGASAGGMLPIAYALMAESVPASARGWLMVAQTGLATVGGYLVASASAVLLEPLFGWRILWVLGLPSGLLLLLLNRWIPESPRFLLAHGRVAEAEAVLTRYGVLTPIQPVSTRPAGPPAPIGRLARLFRSPYTPHTATVLLYGIAWGLVNWGFITFLPTLLRDHRGTSTSSLLFLGALLAVPNTILAAFLYGRWSSRRSMLLYAGMTTAGLLGFTTLTSTAGRDWPLVALVTLLLAGAGGMIAMLAPYAAEIYPTSLRGTGSGLSAAASKVGGMIGPPLISPLAAGLGVGPIALLVAIPVVLAATAIAATGRETSRQPLHEQHLAPTGTAR